MNATLTDELAQLRERHQVALATPPNHSEGELGARVQQLEHQLQQAHAEVAQLGEELATQMQQSSAAELRAAESLKEAADGRASVMALQQQLQDTEQTWKKKLDDMTSTHVLRDSQGRQDLGQAHMLEAEHVAQVEVCYQHLLHFGIGILTLCLALGAADSASRSERYHRHLTSCKCLREVPADHRRHHGRCQSSSSQVGIICFDLY